MTPETLEHFALIPGGRIVCLGCASSATQTMPATLQTLLQHPFLEQHSRCWDALVSFKNEMGTSYSAVKRLTEDALS